MITICVTYFKSLTLANLSAALYSVRAQDLAYVDSVIVVDNDTADAPDEIQAVIDAQQFPVPVTLVSSKHGDLAKTHPWSTNTAVEKASSAWVLFTRADYILDFDFIQSTGAIVRAKGVAWNGFVTGHVYHLTSDIARCNELPWRDEGPRVLRSLPGAEADYTDIDAGVWLMRRDAFIRVGGLDRTLSAWGHAQTEFQHRLFKAGTEFARIPEVLFYHPQHGAPRDIELAHAQLKERGVDLKEMWKRYEGAQPY